MMVVDGQRAKALDHEANPLRNCGFALHGSISEVSSHMDDNPRYSSFSEDLGVSNKVLRLKRVCTQRGREKMVHKAITVYNGRLERQVKPVSESGRRHRQRLSLAGHL